MKFKFKSKEVEIKYKSTRIKYCYIWAGILYSVSCSRAVADFLALPLIQRAGIAKIRLADLLKIHIDIEVDALRWKIFLCLHIPKPIAPQ